MRKIMIWLIFAMLSLTLSDVGHASPESQFFVRQGRDQAFNGGSPTVLSVQNADGSFQSALLSDPADQQALFFRAITRVLVSVEEQGDSVGLTTIRELMEAFGFSLNGSARSSSDDPPNPSGETFLAALDASLMDLYAIDDTTFSVTLMSHQAPSFPTVVVDYGDVVELIAMIQTVRDFASIFPDFDIRDLNQLIIDESMGLLSAQRILLYKFVNPFGYSTVPGAPTIGTATAGNAQAEVSFAAPALDGGSTITSYTVISTPGGKTATGPTSPLSVTGLTNGTAYTFAVVASNATGSSTASAASNSVIPLLIAAPASMTVPPTDTDGAFTVSWEASATAGVGYTIQESTGGGIFTTITPLISTSGNTVNASITGRTIGTTYYYKVKATKAGYTDSAWTIGVNGCQVQLPVITITLLPDSGTVPRGGTLGYTVSAKNNSATSQTFQYWTYVTIPGGSRYPPAGSQLYGPLTVTVAAGKTAGTHLTQKIPTTAPTGTYTYWGNVGGYPTTWDTKKFQFSVPATQ